MIDAGQDYGLMLQNVKVNPLMLHQTNGNFLVFNKGEAVVIIKVDGDNYHVLDRWGYERIIPIVFIQPIVKFKQMLN